MMRLMVLEWISMFVILSVCLLWLGWEIKRLLIFMLSLCVYCGFKVCFVLINVYVLFVFWYLVIVCKVMVVLFEDLGL